MISDELRSLPCTRLTEKSKHAGKYAAERRRRDLIYDHLGRNFDSVEQPLPGRPGEYTTHYQVTDLNGLLEQSGCKTTVRGRPLLEDNTVGGLVNREAFVRAVQNRGNESTLVDYVIKMKRAYDKAQTL